MRRRALLLATLALAGPRPARALQSRYVFDETGGHVDFTAHHLGLFTSTARFGNFTAEVVLDQSDPTRASVSAVLRADTIRLAFPGGEDLLRSPPYFDAARFPTLRFRGAAEGAGVRERFPLKGDLTIRDVTQPFAMEARLLSRGPDPASGGEVANFSATGRLSRAAYGMTADSLIIGDEVEISVGVRLVLARG